MAILSVPILRIIYVGAVGIVAIGAVGLLEFGGPPKAAPKAHAQHNAHPIEINEDALDTGMPMDDGLDVSRTQASTTAPKSQPQTITDEPLAPEPATETFDDGKPDALSGREAAFDQWRKNNADLWEEMDSTIRTCVRARYINAFGISPEAGIDECLDYYSDGD